MRSAGLRCQASTFDPCPFFVFRKEGSTVGAFATHIGDILGSGEPDILAKMRIFLEQHFGELKLQVSSYVRVGMGLAQDSISPVTLSQDEFAKNLHSLPTAPKLRAARQQSLSPEDVELRQRKLCELCSLATAPRPDICARLARIS